MTTTPGAPPPGWYPDPGAPAGSPAARWWDGARWTDHVQAPAVPASRHTGPTTADGQPLAGWWRRALALVMDTLVGVIVALPVSLPAQIGAQRDSAALQDRLQDRATAGESVDLGDFWEATFAPFADRWVTLLLLPALIVLGYHVLMLRWKGATLGKLALDLRVRPRADDAPLGWGAIAARVGVQFALTQVVYLTALVEGSVGLVAAAYLLIVAFGLVDSLVATGPRRQTLHDRAARTVVVRTD